MTSKSAFVSSVVRGTHPPFEPFVLVCQDSSVAHSAWQRIMASLHSALCISPCKFAASGGRRAGKRPNASRPGPQYLKPLPSTVRFGCVGGFFTCPSVLVRECRP